MDETHGSPKPLYLDDLSVGQRFSSATYQMTEARIKSFAAEFDPQPFHLDEALSRRTIFGGLVASGWHMAAVMMRLLVDGGLPFATGIIGLGGEIEWTKPVRPGDTLGVESEIIEIIPSRSKPNQAVVRVRNIMSNQRGDQVQQFVAKILVFKRPAAEPKI
jgi:acyl dehydratase